VAILDLAKCVCAISVPGLGVILYLLIHNSKTNNKNNKKNAKKSMCRNEQTNTNKQETKQTDKQTKQINKNSRFRNYGISVLV
jgi:hypothetical protein